MSYVKHNGSHANGDDFGMQAVDEGSRGSFLERIIFENRPIVLGICVIISICLGLSARNVQLNANFEEMIPAKQEFIQNYFRNKTNLVGFGNTLDIVVQADNGTVLSKHYIDTLQSINDDVFLLPGVDRDNMQSLWTPSVRWTEITSAGAVGGPVMPDNFSGSAADLSTLNRNIQLSGEVGTLVAPDMRSSVIHIPLLDINTYTGKPLDYGTLATQLDALRQRYDAKGVTIHIIGFAMIEGDLIKGMHEVLLFFLASLTVSIGILFLFTRCVRSTMLVVVCSLIAVMWQLGILPLIGFELDPYSVLVPFLVFAIGMSHGAQKMNGVMQDIGRGSASLVAARMTFRRLFMAGFTALVCDAVGFAVLMSVPIAAIHALAIVASLGVAILIFTNLIMLPILLSYVGVSREAAARSLRAETKIESDAIKHPVWAFLDLFTKRRYAAMALGTALVLGGIGVAAARHLQVGDLNPGAPELRRDSVYNLDNDYFVSHYAASSDVFVVMVKTPSYGCANYNTVAQIEDLENKLSSLPGVISTKAFPDLLRNDQVQSNEGNFDWYDLSPNQAVLNEGVGLVPRSVVDVNCDFQTLSVYLHDHKATTLRNVVDTVGAFAKKHNNAKVQYLMAAGNAGIAAATNIVVSQASTIMLYEVYSAVIVLCLIAFRSWRAILVAILPLMLTSVLAEALMVALGIGVKVATLPVTALGVGIGVDYALYILSVTKANLERGMNLSEAYYRALLFTGRVVLLTGSMLAVAVMTWVFSPIKFQADMGELLAFMFLWNMIGALILLPSLSAFLLKPNSRSEVAGRTGAAL